jgi:hypothetical protein
MNSYQPTAPSSQSPPCRHAATLLSTTALLASAAPLVAAVIALTPAPLAATVPVAAPASARHASPPIGASTGSRTTVQAGAIGVDKYPREAGD